MADKTYANQGDGTIIKRFRDMGDGTWAEVHAIGDIIPGSGATDLGKAEDAVHASGDVGVMALAVRKDTAAALAGTDGDYAPVEIDATGRLHVNSELPDAAALSDALANPTVPGVGSHLLVWDGTTWGRVRNNVEATVLASAARTATANSADQTNYNGRGARVFLDVTVASGTGGLTLKIQGKDPVSGAYVDLLTSATFITTGLRAFTVYPGVAVAANQSASDILDRTWRVRVEAGDASSYTYSVGSVVLL